MRRIGGWRTTDGRLLITRFMCAFALILALACAGCAAPQTDAGEAPEQAEVSAAPVSAQDIEATPAIIPPPEFTGEAAVEIDGGIPSFTEEELARDTFAVYAPLDEIGRATVAFAMVSDETRPPQGEKRPSLSEVHPSGWNQAFYDHIPGQSLFNRSHLIAWSLSGEGANPCNLITATTTLNQEVMQGYEQSILSHIRNTGNHVLVRATPIYEGDELVARGVHYEAQSIEDAGEAISINVFIWNIEPGVDIDYATGESALSPTENEVNEGTAVVAGLGMAAAAGGIGAATTDAVVEIDAAASVGKDYVLNTNTKKFHYPSCSSVSKMKEKNKEFFSGDRETIIQHGYEPCKNCNP